jgi:GlpG protein
MRQIGNIDKDQDAERFSDYLVTQGIENMVEEMAAGGAWAVWVENDDHLDRGRAALEQFRANPADPRYEAAGQAEKLRKQAEKAEKRRRQNFIDVRTRWSQPGQLAKPVTIALAVLSILASVLGTKLGLVNELPTPLENAMLIAPVTPVDDNRVTWEGLDAVKHGQVWRLVTPIFLHFSILHLIFNMFWLFDLGSLVETRRGSVFLALMVVVTAAVSNIAEFYFDLSLTKAGLRQSPLFGGMSGINYALFGYAWIKGKYQPHLGIGVSQQTTTVLLFWLVLCMTSLVGPVANVAHVVGLLGGVAFAYVPFAFSRLLRRR